MTQVIFPCYPRYRSRYLPSQNEHLPSLSLILSSPCEAGIDPICAYPFQLTRVRGGWLYINTLKHRLAPCAQLKHYTQKNPSPLAGVIGQPKWTTFLYDPQLRRDHEQCSLSIIFLRQQLSVLQQNVIQIFVLKIYLHFYVERSFSLYNKFEKVYVGSFLIKGRW
jgi:hypothetical protein